MTKIINHVRASFILVLLCTLLTGAVYPGIVTALSQLLFPSAANGSLITRHGTVVGSSLIGQEFTGNSYFWGRLSATTPAYNAAASSGSNLSPANPELQDAVKARIGQLQKAEKQTDASVPADLATASASGLDPHISVAAALYQLPRVAKARKLPTDAVLSLVKQHIETPGFGLLGAPYVNVLRLNIALDELAAKTPKEKR